MRWNRDGAARRQAAGEIMRADITGGRRVRQASGDAARKIMWADA